MKLDDSIIAPWDVPVLSFGHSQVQIVAAPEVIGATDVCILRGILPAASDVPLHSHADPESFFVLSGELDGYQDEGLRAGWKTVRKGELAVIRSNVKHAWRNRSSEACIALIVTGSEMCNFFREAGVPQPVSSESARVPPDPDAMTKLGAIAAKYHMWLASPQENAAIGLTVP